MEPMIGSRTGNRSPRFTDASSARMPAPATPLGLERPPLAWDHPSVPPLRVLLVDDHEVVRQGIASLLKATDDIVVAGEAGTVRDAIEEAERIHPDVVVMDVRLADGS